jgi:HK97 family phage portal protein
MGLGSLFARSTQYTATDTKTGATQAWTAVDNIAPDWSTCAYSGGMGLPGAWRASILLSDLLGGVPWHAYRKRVGDEAPVRLDPTPPFLEQPAPPDPRITTLSSMALDLIWHGNAIALIASRNREGWPTSYLPVPAEYVAVKRVGATDPIVLPVGVVAYEIGDRWYPAEDVVHVKGPCRPGALRGMGVLENHLNGTLKLADEQARQARSIGTSGVPTGVLKSTDPEFDQEDADALKAGWMRTQRDRTVAVLSPTTDYTALAWNPSETQLLEARRFSLHETALLFGLDPSWLGAQGASMTYSNVEQEAVNLVKFSLGGHLARFEQTFTLHMPRGTEAKANLDAVLRADTLTRYQAHAIAIAAKFLTDDEVRGLENRPPLTPAQRKAATPPAPAPAPQPAGQGPTSEDPKAAA